MAKKNPDPTTSELNIAGRIANYFVDSKLTILIILVALLAGSMAIFSTPREWPCAVSTTRKSTPASTNVRPRL